MALARQDPAPDEIIVVDDGSTDDSLETVERLRRQLPSLRLLRNERNLGVIPSLNRGIEATSGRYVYLGSANDMVEAGFLATARQMLETYPDCGFFAAECRLTDLEGRELAIRPPARPSLQPSYLNPERVRALLTRIDNFAPSSSVVLSRAAVDEAGGLPPELGSFADGYLIRCVALQRGFCFAPVVGSSWTIDPASVSRTTAGQTDLALTILRTALGKMRSAGVFPDEYLGTFERRWRFGIGRVAAGAGRQTLMELDAVVAPGPAERVVWRGLSWVPSVAGRLLRLAWLTLRFRPFSLTALVATRLARWRRATPGSR